MRAAIALVLVLVLVCAVPLASAQKAVGITQAYVAGIHLGASQARARASMTKPVRLDRLEDGYLRFLSPGEKLEAYFRTGTKGVAVVTTWNRQLTTAEGIGPCSTVAALRRAYSGRLVPFRQGGRIVAYRLGNVIFTVLGGRRVGAVALGRGTQAVYVALSATSCANYGTRTAAPSIRPARRWSSASFAWVNGKASIRVRTGTRGASARNSSPSARVRFATERSRRSPQSSS
jgi:hypothetical protein